MAGLSRSMATLNIKAHQDLNPILNAGITAMLVSYSPSHAYAISSNRYHTVKAQVLPEKWADRRYAIRSEPFWWSCLSKKETATKKRILRSWMARRTRIAFVESLKQKGYNPDGTRLDPTDGVEVLYGTAQLTPKEPCLRIKSEDLRKETDLVLEGIFKMIEKRRKKESGPNQGGRNQTSYKRGNAGKERNSSTQNKRNSGGLTITKIAGWQTPK